MIGSWGEIVFDTVGKLKIPTGINHSTSARWAEHTAAGAKPQTEFVGPNNRTVSFSMMLRADLGGPPRMILEQLRKDVAEGNHYELVIGGDPIGDGTWKCSSISESWDIILSGGELYKATVQVSLEEYT